MKLHNLVNAENIIIQILWGEKTIEFTTKVIDKDSEGVFVSPYLRNGVPLELNIDMHSGIICNIFGDNPDDGSRVSWRNVDLSSVKKNDKLFYYLRTSAFNSEANIDERREADRIKITKDGTLYDSVSKRTVAVRINDISDSGIAFYAPSTYEPSTNTFLINFSDEVNGQKFDIKVKCSSVRTKKMTGTVFYGCKTVEDNREYLLYGCLTRLMKNADRTGEPEE